MEELLTGESALRPVLDGGCLGQMCIQEDE
jgi:hypothetical protein